jgi:hypothetical protein
LFGDDPDQVFTMMFKSVGTWHAGEGWQTYTKAASPTVLLPSGGEIQPSKELAAESPEAVGTQQPQTVQIGSWTVPVESLQTPTEDVASVEEDEYAL